MESPQQISDDDLSRMLEAKMSRSGIDPHLYQEQLANIRSLFEPSSSHVIGQDIFINFRGIRHTFRSLREVASAFAIPLSTQAPGQTNSSNAMPVAQSLPFPPSLPPATLPPVTVYPTAMARPRPAELTSSEKKKPQPTQQAAVRVNVKGNGRVGSQFQDENLVNSIQEHLGMEVTCGDLRAKLVRCDLSGLLFELLDADGHGTGNIYPTSRLARQSNLAHQNNSWKSIKVPVGGSYHTLDYWVTTLQSKLYKDNEGMNVEMYQVPKKRRRTTNMAEDSEDEDLDEDDDNWSDDDEHASGSRPRKSRSGHIKRKEYSTHAPAPSASDHQVARLTEEVRVLRQRVRTLEGIIQKAMSSAALLTSQLQVPPSDFS